MKCRSNGQMTLSCHETVQALEQRLMQLPADGYALWADALDVIRSEAFSYERAHRTTDF